MKTLYTTTAIATGDGRNGHVQTTDGLLDADVRMPAQLGGPGGATNPEQLFAAGYAACFHSALKLVAGADGVDTTDSEVVADVSLGALENGAFGAGRRARGDHPGRGSRDSREGRRARPPGLPLLQRHARQHRGRPHCRVTQAGMPPSDAAAAARALTWSHAPAASSVAGGEPRAADAARRWAARGRTARTPR